MAQTNTPKLDAGDLFPTMTLNLTDGGVFVLPQELNAKLTIFLGYRGKW